MGSPSVCLVLLVVLSVRLVLAVRTPIPDQNELLQIGEATDLSTSENRSSVLLKNRLIGLKGLAARGKDKASYLQNLEAIRSQIPHRKFPDADKVPPEWQERLVGYRMAGNGSFGTVLLARAKCQGASRVAIKTQKDNDIVEQEIALMERMKDPYLPWLWATNRSGDTVSILMEGLGGGDLSEVMAGGVSRVETASIIIDLIEAVRRISSKGFVHRDIKPGNVMLTSTYWRSSSGDRIRRAKLIDFGLVCEKGSTECGHFAGTLSYMAPELLEDSEIQAPATTASDMWGVGMIAYMLTMWPNVCELAGGVICDKIGGGSDSTTKVHRLVSGYNVFRDRNLVVLSGGTGVAQRKLLEGLLNPNPLKRSSPEKALLDAKAWAETLGSTLPNEPPKSGSPPCCTGFVLRDLGYKITKTSKHSWHMYAQCNSETPRKVSCVKKECEVSGEQGCFVQARCHAWRPFLKDNICKEVEPLKECVDLV